VDFALLINLTLCGTKTGRVACVITYAQWNQQDFVLSVCLVPGLIIHVEHTVTAQRRE
jgi:hypothetical protein